jgi:hypothetical protein
MSGYAAAWCRFVVDHLQAAPVGSYDGLDRGVVRVDVGGVDGHAYGGDLEVVADPGQHLPAVLGGYRLRAMVLPTRAASILPSCSQRRSMP